MMPSRPLTLVLVYWRFLTKARAGQSRFGAGSPRPLGRIVARGFEAGAPVSASEHTISAPQASTTIYKSVASQIACINIL